MVATSLTLSNPLSIISNVVYLCNLNSTLPLLLVHGICSSVFSLPCLCSLAMAMRLFMFDILVPVVFFFSNGFFPTVTELFIVTGLINLLKRRQKRMFDSCERFFPSWYVASLNILSTVLRLFFFWISQLDNNAFDLYFYLLLFADDKIATVGMDSENWERWENQ